MPRGPTRPWRALAPHTAQMMPVVRTVLEKIGYEREAVWNGNAAMPCTTWDDALQCQRGIYNSANHLGVSAQCRIEPTGDGHRVVFKLFDKRKARASHVKRHGSDRSRWPYNPRAKGNI